MARALVFAPKTARRGDVIEIRTLIAHPMETGQRVDAEGRAVPIDLIRRFECRYDGATVFAAELYTAIAANPLLTFHLLATASGPVELRWSGDKGFEQVETISLVVT